MFPLHKLEQLPRCQRLRKIEKIFAEVENRLCAANLSISSPPVDVLPTDRRAFLAAVAELLQKDALFAPAAQAVFAEAVEVLRPVADKTIPDGPAVIADKSAQICRVLSTMRHILIIETGRSQADWDFIDTAGKLDPALRRPFLGMCVYLEDIRSPFNVGALFRTAESFGVEKMYLSPLCADPLHPRAQRSAMGCIDALPWERQDLLADQRLANQRELPADQPMFALETGGTPLSEFTFPRRGMLIVGAEELGVSPKALAAADSSLGRVSIPCYGAKRSLNVSVAFGIVMQAWAAACAIH